MINGRYLLKWAENILCLVLVVFFSFLVYLMVQQEKNGGEPPSLGGYKLMIVMSGSMKPAFDTGALIAVKKVDPEGIMAGEIITYIDGENTGRLITHRVVEVVHEKDGIFFITKGDDNDTRDFSLIPTQNVIGKVMGAVPYMGYLAGFLGSKMGVLVFLIIPVMLVVIGEFRAVRQIFRKNEDCKGG